MRHAATSRRVARRAFSAASLAGAGLLAFAALRFGASDTTAEPPDDEARAAKSAAAFLRAYEVFQHPRCVNCHPSGDRPLQGDDSHPHAQNVKRGPDGGGLYALKCAACHQDRNLPGDRMPPGAPTWHLPRKSAPLVFEGMTPAALAEQMKDRSRNGDMSLGGVVDHVAHDKLVAWGWAPGDGREPAPGTQAEFAAAVAEWIEYGAATPKE